MLPRSPDTGITPSRTVRRYPRYPVTGSLFVDTGELVYFGAPVDLGLGGVFFQADPVPSVGTCGTLHLQVAGFNETLIVEVQVIRTLGATATVIFLTPSATLTRCIAMLAG